VVNLSVSYFAYRSTMSFCQKLTDFWHENLTNLPTLRVRCSHFTLGNPKKLFSTLLFTHTSDSLCYLRRKPTVIHLPTPPENVTTLTCELQNFLKVFFIWLKFCCLLPNVGGSEWKEPVVVGGSEKNWLWCAVCGMSGKQCHSKCSEWPPSTLIHASSLFRHWSVA